MLHRQAAHYWISIHALLAESDGVPYESPSNKDAFLSTLSLRRATLNLRITCVKLRISIHALLAESDGRAFRSFPRRNTLFLSTLSLRRATKAARAPHPPWQFLSTLSLRRATAKVHKTVGHFCAYETNFMGIASSC